MVAAPYLFRVPLAVLVAGIVAIPWAVAVRELHNPVPVRTTARPHAIVWGNLVFWNKEDLQRWLRSHGASYGTWSDRHPTALLSRPRPAQVAPKAPVHSRPAAQVTPKAPVHSRPAAQVTPKAPVHSRPAAQVTPKAPEQSRPAAESKSAAKRRVVEAARLPTVAPGGRSMLAEALELLLLSLGTIAVAVAFTPVPVLRTILRGHHQLLTPDARVSIAGCGLVTLVGVAISVMLG